MGRTIEKKPEAKSTKAIKIVVDNEISKRVANPIPRSYDRVEKTISNDRLKSDSESPQKHNTQKRPSLGELDEVKQVNKKTKKDKLTDLQISVRDSRPKQRNKEYKSISVKAGVSGRFREVAKEPEPELEYYSDEYFSADETDEKPKSPTPPPKSPKKKIKQITKKTKKDK